MARRFFRNRSLVCAKNTKKNIFRIATAEHFEGSSEHRMKFNVNEIFKRIFVCVRARRSRRAMPYTFKRILRLYTRVKLYLKRREIIISGFPPSSCDFDRSFLASITQRQGKIVGSLAGEFPQREKFPENAVV
jgi:hypothetical protein